MRHLTAILLTSLALWSLITPVYAKSNLPVKVTCHKSSEQNAVVKVRFTASATSVVVTVKGSGSVVMDRLVKRAAVGSKGEVLTIPVDFVAGKEAGGLVVQVKGDFGRGTRSQIQAFDLIEAQSSNPANLRTRTSEGKAPAELIIVPAKTSVEER